MARVRGVVAVAARAALRRDRTRRARARPAAPLRGHAARGGARPVGGGAPVAGPRRRARRSRHRSADRRHPLLRLDAGGLERRPRRARGAPLPVARDRSVSRDRAAPRRDVGAGARAARAGDEGGSRRRDLGGGDCRPRQQRRADARRGRGAAVRRRCRPVDARRSPRRRRLHPRRSGRSARRILHPRRPGRRLPARRGAARPRRVPRRHHRDAAPLRRPDAAVDRDDRPRPAAAAA